MHGDISCDLSVNKAIIMSYKYEINFEIDIIRGEAKEMNSDNFIEQKMCHKFVIGEKINDSGPSTGEYPLPSNCKYTLHHEGNVEEEWLYGPITNLNHQVIYPCSRFRCSIPCPCYLCQRKEYSNLSKYEQLKDHNYFHKTCHHNCSFCENIIQCFPNFNYWFLSKNIRVLYGTREHFKIKHPLVNTTSKPCQMKDEHTHPMDPANLLETIHYADYETYNIKYKNLLYSDKIICEECNYLVDSIDQYREHIELNHTISKRFFHAYHNTDFTKRHEPFRCFQCDEIFPSRSKLSRHAQRAHFEVLFKCGLCQEKFTFKDNLDRHWKAIHKGYKESNEIFSCDTCGMKFPVKGNYTRHLKIHAADPNEVFSCDTCGMQFPVKHNYTRHLKLHDEPKEKFNCDTCGMEFSVKSNYTRHLKLHDESKEKFNCDTCGMQFTAKWNYERHLKRQQKIFCSICDAKFCTFLSFTQHNKLDHEGQAKRKL